LPLAAATAAAAPAFRGDLRVDVAWLRGCLGGNTGGALADRRCAYLNCFPGGRRRLSPDPRPLHALQRAHPARFRAPAKSFTSFTVESASVEVGSPVFNEFVKGSMLLDADKFPKLSFISTSAEKVDGRTARVTDDLTMLGVTKPVTLTVSVDNDDTARSGIVSFVAIVTIKRSDYGMIFGIPLIDNALEITVKTRALTDE
jgi:polyisoprenoid-binding protein YceI